MVKPEPDDDEDDDGDVPIKDEPDDDDDTPMDEIPEPPPVADAATGEFPDGSDNSGMHPTPTTYTKTLIVESATQGEEFATPTAESYHKSVDLAAVQLYNEQISEELEFNDGTETWSNYTHDGDYTTTTWSSGNPRKHMWVEGFQVRYSWDWTSSLTKNYYPNITPTWVYASNGKAMYYWFDVIFNDWQAFHGYANYARSKDGLPSLNWPGMVKCKHSFFGGSQRPRQRGLYEDWFYQNFEDGINYCAPHIRDVSLLPSAPLPKRRRIVDITGRTTRDEDQIFETGPQQPIDPSPQPTQLPTFTRTGPMPFGLSYVGNGFTQDLSKDTMEVSTPWLSAFTGYNQAAIQGSYSEEFTLLDAQSIYPHLVMRDGVNYYGFPRVTRWQFGNTCEVYSAYLRQGSPTQLCGWLIRWYQSDQPLLVVTGYGYKSVAPVALSGMAGNKSTYDLATQNVQEEIRSVMKLPATSDNLGFMYDASVGQYGQVTWLSQL